MKNFKGFALGLVMGLALAISSIGFAQTTTQTDTPKTKESCCAMSSCCGGSCAMKHDANQTAKDQSAHKGCCCCGGDSCETKMKEKHDKHNAKQG